MIEHKNLPGTAGNSGQLWKLRGIKKGNMDTSKCELHRQEKQVYQGPFWQVYFVFVLSTPDPRFLPYLNDLLIAPIGLCYLSSLRISRC